MKHGILLLLPVLLTGCGNLHGLIDAGDQFGCGVAPGVRCATLSENFERQERAFAENARLTVADDEEFAGGDAPAATGKRAKHRKTARTEATAKAPEKPAAQAETPAKAAALRRPAAKSAVFDERYPRAARTFLEPRRAAEVVMQLWVMPWVDADGDFHAESRVWLKVKDARWQIERERSRATARAADPGASE